MSEEYTKAVRIEDEEEEVNDTRVATTRKKTNATKKKKKKRHVNFFLIFALIICIIPCAVVGYIIYDAMQDSNSVINGERFANDLNPAISEDIQNSIVEGIKKIDGVQNVQASLKTATLRIMVDMNDLLTEEDADTIGQAVVEVVDKYAPLKQYFTSSGIKKMYDLEIIIYDMYGDDVNTSVYVIYSKNAAHEEVTHQSLMSAKNPEKVAEIEAKRYAEAHPEEASASDTASDSDAASGADTATKSEE